MGAREFANPRLGARTRKAIVDFMLNPSPNFKGPKQDVEKKQDEMLVGIPDEVYVLNSANFEDFVDSNSKDMESRPKYELLTSIKKYCISY